MPFFYKQLPIDANETEFVHEVGQINVSDVFKRGERGLKIYCWIWGENPKIFLLDDTVYLDIVLKDKNRHYVFSLDKEGYCFD
ncbi:MAG: hypothetical protein LBP40_06230 [Campylobacteraceae bacterium]|jgi:hypothetical protein|nr:hypothetical protein [Campylobacteraceae bacterium]